jgi:dolichol-phosphate mannosyltransferase
VLGVDVRDLTGGFKCFRASALRAIDFGSATAQGYAFQVELTWRVLCLGLTVVEVPIRFRERRLGESKMSARIAREAAWRVPALRFGSARWRPVEAEARAADAVMHEG